MTRSTGDTDGIKNMSNKDTRGVHGRDEHRCTCQQVHPLPPTSLEPTTHLTALFTCSPWPHLTCSPFSPFSFTCYSPPLFPRS